MVKFAVSGYDAALEYAKVPAATAPCTPVPPWHNHCANRRDWGYIRLELGHLGSAARVVRYFLHVAMRGDGELGIRWRGSRRVIQAAIDVGGCVGSAEE